MQLFAQEELKSIILESFYQNEYLLGQAHILMDSRLIFDRLNQNNSKLESEILCKITEQHVKLIAINSLLYDIIKQMLVQLNE